MIEISRISVEGFRRLTSIHELDLRPLTVVIGANGVGKTSLLDVLALLGASASGQLNSRLSELNGLSSLLTRGIADSLNIEVEAPVANPPPLKYKLELEPQGQSYAIRLETLSQHVYQDSSQPHWHITSKFDNVKYFDTVTHKLISPTWQHERTESSLSQVPKMFQQCEDVRRRLASVLRFGSVYFDVSSKGPVRLPQQMRPASLPGLAGEDLVSCLYYLRETDRDRFDVVSETLQAAFPDFDRLDFPPVAAGTLAMTWKDKAFAKPMYTHELSEGTLRFLWLVSILMSTELPRITLIDEPEASLHPEMLRLLVDLMRDAAQRTQLVVATHSERLIRFLDPREVLVLDLADGRAVPAWADEMDIEEWLSEYALDDLWRLGRIGGRA